MNVASQHGDIPRGAACAGTKSIAPQLPMRDEGSRGGNPGRRGTGLPPCPDPSASLGMTKVAGRTRVVRVTRTQSHDTSHVVQNQESHGPLTYRTHSETESAPRAVIFVWPRSTRGSTATIERVSTTTELTAARLCERCSCLHARLTSNGHGFIVNLVTERDPQRWNRTLSVVFRSAVRPVLNKRALRRATVYASCGSFM
jgi:hypothetical protein